MSITRKLCLLAALLLAATPLFARQRISGWCSKGGQTVSVSGLTSTSKVQASYPGCTVTVHPAGDAVTLSSIYADNSGTVKGNPFTADLVTGYWFFYVDNGRYDVVVSGGGLSAPYTFSDLWALDVSDGVTVTTLSVSGTGTTTLYYLGKTDHSGVVASRTNTATLGGDADYSFLSHRFAAAGGTYGATQSAFGGFNSDTKMQTRGQAIGFHFYNQALGIGNGVGLDGQNECWGGSADVSPGSIPACEGAEITNTIGSGLPNKSVFSATLDLLVGTTLTYSAATNESALGERFLLDKDRTYSTGTVSYLGAGVFQGAAGTVWTTGMVGKYFKTGSTTDFYATPCVGNDQAIDGFCFGHWFKITNVDEVLQQLTVEAYFDSTNLTSGPGASYLIMDGAEITSNGGSTPAIDTTAKTLTLSSATTLGGVAGDTIYSPPNPLIMPIGLNILVTPRYLLGRGSMNAPATLRLKNANLAAGPPEDIAIDIVGAHRTLLRWTLPGFGVDGIDLNAGSFTHSAMWVGQNQSFLFGADGNFQAQQVYDGTSHVFYGPKGTTRSVKFIGGWDVGTAQWHSTLSIDHPALSQLEFTNGSAYTWLNETLGVVRFNKAVKIGTDAATGTQDALSFNKSGQILFRNELNSGDIVGLKKLASNAVQCGDTAGCTLGANANNVAITGHLSRTASLDFDLTGAGITCQDLDIGGFVGLADGDTVSLGIPVALASTAGVTFSWWVKDATTVTVRACDVTGGNPDPAAATVRADVWKH